MEFPATTIGVFEENKTRAELYALWLEEYDVRVASSKQRAQATIDDELGVAVVSSAFADGAAETLVDIVKTESPLCRVLAVRPRTVQFPEFESADSLAKPVFEEDLRAAVEGLLRRLNYQLALQLYYRTTMDLAAHEGASPADSPDSEEVERLRQQAATLQSRLTEYRETLSDEDIAAVMRALTIENTDADDKEQVDSKYWPDKCPNCGEEWESEGDATLLKRIAAYVWRCTACGNVLLGEDSGRGQPNLYRT